jgi:hypothetical protein
MAIYIQEIDVTISTETLQKCKRLGKKIKFKTHQYCKGVSADHDVTVGLGFINVRSYYNVRGKKSRQRTNVSW